MGGLHNFCPEEEFFSLVALCFLHTISYNNCKFSVVLCCFVPGFKRLLYQLPWWQEFGLKTMPRATHCTLISGLLHNKNLHLPCAPCVTCLSCLHGFFFSALFSLFLLLHYLTVSLLKGEPT